LFVGVLVSLGVWPIRGSGGLRLVFDWPVVPMLLPVPELEEPTEPPDEPPPEPPPDPPPPPCASAKVELRARTEASAIAVRFMRVSVTLVMTSMTPRNYLMFQPPPAERGHKRAAPLPVSFPVCPQLQSSAR